MSPQILPRSPLFLALAALLATALPVAHAADAADAAGAGAATTAEDDARERRTPELEKVEVLGNGDHGYAARRTSTATRTDTALQDVPQSVTIVTSELMRDQRMQGMADVVRYVPGAGMAQGEGNRDTPILRGSSSTADLFVDGMRDDVQYFRDLYNIERVEALKGPNAMIFGRGGSGGVLNRVSKQADWDTVRELDLTWGSWNRGRAVADFGQALGDSFAFRVSALREETDSFRDGVESSRRGVNPDIGWRVGDNTTLNLGYEHFEDARTADRGVPSFAGRPVDVDPSTFFGDPARSRSEAEVDALNLLLEHDFGNGVKVRNRSRAARYDKFYQNIFPGAVSANGANVSISAYNNGSQRENLFNQTDLTWDLDVGGWNHTLLGGFEFGRQESDNRRETGYFPTGSCPAVSSPSGPSSVNVSLANPRYEGLVCFRQSATDGDNHGVARVAAAYVQDQIEFSPQWQAIFGLRYDRFELDFHNNRNGQDISSQDDLLSPRVGLVWKPVPEASIYGSYSIAYLPRSGEQLTSLSLTNAALDPEEYSNVEIGAKWQLTPELNLTAAIYQLGRANVIDASDPNHPILLAGDSQRVRGVEVGVAGDIGERWHLMGGYAWQKGEITRDIPTSPIAVLAKGTELAQVPRHSFSLWNRVDLGQRWGVGLGLVARSRVYAQTTNAVTLPGFVRTDAALFYTLSPKVGLQLNVENLFDLRYFANAHSDNNISPGSPRAISLGLNLDL